MKMISGGNVQLLTPIGITDTCHIEFGDVGNRKSLIKPIIDEFIS
ncbi:Uncharacterised protein [Sphingobacterium multivorum]|uniref:Uncharacterized protein n=1 Tax=Sphingobacterium multivorum TaxID=28454 RepID=A0A2X2J5T3_SPHMU|nr:Uncharacterised protein [Sphingobacterium multivorum]